LFTPAPRSAAARFDYATSEGVTDAVFHILRNANVLQPITQPNVVVCWGGHSIKQEEYEYTKLVGYQLGLRGLNDAPVAAREP
jgi:hypothetical protein